MIWGGPADIQFYPFLKKPPPLFRETALFDGLGGAAGGYDGGVAVSVLIAGGGWGGYGLRGGRRVTGVTRSGGGG